jgi:hypothetical protein
VALAIIIGGVLFSKRKMAPIDTPVEGQVPVPAGGD